MKKVNWSMRRPLYKGGLKKGYWGDKKKERNANHKVHRSEIRKSLEARVTPYFFVAFIHVKWDQSIDYVYEGCQITL